jgi:hypothetical protein
MDGIAGIAAERVALLVLGFLVAVDRIVEVMGEVVPQRHRRVDAVEAQRELPVGADLLVEVAGEAVAQRLAVIGRVERAEAADQP